MGRSVGIRPNPYTPRSVALMKERIAAEIVATITEKKVTPAEIARRYPSVRAGDLQNLRRGEHDVYGINRLVAIAEALGISFSLERAA